MIKARCFRFMSLYHLKPCMSRSRTAWSWWVSLAEHSRSSFALFVSVLCVGFSISPGDAIGGHQWEVQSLSAGIHAGAHHYCSVPKNIFTSRERWLLLWRRVVRFHKNVTLPQKCTLSHKLWDIFWRILWSFTSCNYNTWKKCVRTLH
jgi:hypothetical protein